MSANRYDFPVSTLYGLVPVVGEVGCEIEVEGTNLPTFRYHWRQDDDGSLRRLNPETDQAIEYVLREPVPRADLPKVFDHFAKKWGEAQATSYDTYRCSVHVHLNVGDWPMRRVFSFLTAWIILEELMVDWADGGTNHRVGNRFCLRAKDAEEIISGLQQIVKNDFRGRIDARTFKYGAVNIAALAQYGSLEFRALRGTTDTKIIQQWIKMLLAIKDYASKFDDPSEIIQQFSGSDPIKWASDILGDDFASVCPNLRAASDKLFIGMRLAQDVGYATNWQPYKVPEKVELKTKPSTTIDLDTFIDMDVRTEAGLPLRARFPGDADVDPRNAGVAPPVRPTTGEAIRRAATVNWGVAV